MAKTKNKYSYRLKTTYWILVTAIFISLIFMVHYVLDHSKVYVNKNTVIRPYLIEWTFEDDGTLKINEPFYLNTDAKLIDKDIEVVKNDSLLNALLNSDAETAGSFIQLEPPYLIWKNAKSDTIHVMKNDISLNFLIKKHH